MSVAITHSYVLQQFSYDPDSGILTNRVDRNTNGKDGLAGAEAGRVYTTKKGKSYREVGLGGKKMRVHRVIYFYMTGCWPPQQIDHQDGNGLNNRWSNLRPVSQQGNNMNMRRLDSNTSGQTGVSWDKRRKRWAAFIKTDRRKKHLGRYKEIGDAIAARKAAELSLGFHPNHGMVRPA